jgi:hypothetical protein
MSSVTNIKPRPRYRVETEVALTGWQPLDLSQLLGAGGCRLIEHTLRSRQRTDWTSQDGGVAWTWSEQETRAEAKLTSELPEGFSALTLQLELRGSTACLRYAAQYGRIEVKTNQNASTIPPDARQRLKTYINRSVNRLLSECVTVRIQERLREKKVTIEQTRWVQRQQQALGARQQLKASLQTIAKVS